VPGGDIARAIRAEWDQMSVDNLEVEDPNPTIHPERNPLQDAHHGPDEVEAIAAHLKRSLEGVVFEVFQHARTAAEASGHTDIDAGKPVQVRWVEACFPFTSPSWELEVYWEGDWLEVLGCGVVRQGLLINAGVPDQLGWAFGLGLDRIAMLMFGIPDIRLLWSQDPRFLSQFTSIADMKRFVPFSKHPACYKDVAFWLRSASRSAGGGGSGNIVPQGFHENDVMEIVREVGGNLVEDVRLVDEFLHPRSGRKSLCYRINYRSLERTLRNEEANQLHEEVRRLLVEKLRVELR
jgi:phenylalanyl-tRNA synthetase alpha chain